jgi:tight adherence protein C
MTLLSGNPDLVVALLAALSVFSAMVVVSWPYIYVDTLGQRLKEVADERAALRVRERGRMNAHRAYRNSLRPEPKKIYKEIYERFNLEAQANDAKLIRRLAMAGYRGRARVVTYLAARVLAPIVVFIVVALYMLVLAKIERSIGFKLAIALGAAAAAYYAPAIFLKNKITKRQLSIRRAWPDALDLMLICVDAGMSMETALRKIAQEVGPQSVELAEELTLTTAELSYLPDRRKAFTNLADRTGLDSVRAVVAGLVQAEQYGTSIGQVLRVLAQESRDTRMSDAEKKAHALPPKLTVPMILFFLPVLFAVICTPAAIQIMNVR